MKNLVRERVRDEIRAELARHDPLESARGPLELIAETSIRFVEDGDAIRPQVVDADGRPRTKQQDGATVELTIQDLVAELRASHPTLFRAMPDDGPAASNGHSSDQVAQNGPPQDGSARDPVEAAAPADALPDDPGERPRDWLFLGSGEQALSDPPAARGRTGFQGLGGMALGRIAAHLRGAPGILAGKFDGLRAALPGWRTPPGAPQGAPAAQPGRRTRLYGAFAGALVLALAGYLLLGPSARPPSVSSADRGATPAAPPRAPSEPTPAGPAPQPQSNPAGAISGVPEVIDTSTLRLDGKVIRLFGVEWARGAQPDDLTRYLRNRAVSCRPAAADAYRCEVEGRDLSEVVLYNGGGRAASNATPDLLAAENHARSERLGIWRR